MEILYSPRFSRLFKKLDEATKDLYREREALFRENPFNPVLKTHKLHGKMEPLWAFSLDYELRAAFEFASENVIWMQDIGDHDMYD